MDLHFCDICNESVPQPDLSAGRAVQRKGRVICGSCESAMSGEAVLTVSDGGALAAISALPVAGTPTSGTGSGAKAASRASMPAAGGSGAFLAGALAAVAILFSLGVLLMLQERVERLEGEGAYTAELLRAELESTSRALGNDVDAARAFALDELEALDGDLAGLRGEFAAGAVSARDTRSELVGGLDRLRERLDQTDARLEKAVLAQGRGGDLQRLRADVALLDDELRALSTRLRGVEELAALGSLGSMPAAGEAPPAWLGLVDQLVDPSAGVRWSAVQALGETGAAAVVPHLLPALDDGDIFVRMAAARILGDLGSLEAIPALIETLADEEPSVREAAAVTLRLLSGRTFRFDPTANENDRRRRIASWQDWWDRSRDDLLDS